MKVIVCGAGDVGRHLAEVLSGQGHGVTMVDVRAEPLRKCILVRGVVPPAGS